MAEIVSAEGWRKRVRLGGHAIVSAHVPESVSAWVRAFAEERGLSVSAVVRSAIISWVMALSSPNLGARREFLRWLLAVQVTGEQETGAVDWFDDLPHLRRELEHVVMLRESDADTARRVELDRQISQGVWAEPAAVEGELGDRIRGIIREMIEAAQLAAPPDLVIVDIGPDGAGIYIERAEADRAGLTYRERRTRKGPAEGQS